MDFEFWPTLLVVYLWCACGHAWWTVFVTRNPSWDRAFPKAMIYVASPLLLVAAGLESFTRTKPIQPDEEY